MPRNCSLCARSDRDAIDEAIRAKMPYRTVAVRFGTSKTTVTRHAEHVLRAVALASPPIPLDKVPDTSFLDQMKELQAKARYWLAIAEKEQSSAAACAWVKELRATMESGFKMAMVQRQAERDLPALPPLNLSDHPLWPRVRNTIFDALDAFPEAREAVLDTLNAPDIAELTTEPLSAAVRDLIDRVMEKGQEAEEYLRASNVAETEDSPESRPSPGQVTPTANLLPTVRKR